MIAASFLLCTAASAPASLQHDTLVVGPDHAVVVTIDGRPARFVMLANGGYHPILDRASDRIRKRAATAIDDVTNVHFAVGGRPVSNYAFSSAKPIPGRYEAAIGPYSVPQRVVTFQLRAAKPGERAYALPLTNMHDDAVHANDAGMGTIVRVGPAWLFVQWDLTRDGASATSAAVPDLMERHGAAFREAGGRGDDRHLVLARPLAIGPLRITEMAIPPDERDASGAGAAGDEIVVTGARHDPDAPRSLLLGRDTLARCSSLTFDRAKRTVVLSCVPA